MSVTSKNTKQEILEELERVNKQLKEMKTACSNPIKEAAETRAKEVVVSAEADVKANIFSDEMNKKFLDVQEAIEVQENKLKDLFGVEKELTDLTVALNAAKELKAALQKELDNYRQDMDDKKRAAIKETQEAIANIRKEYEIRADELKDERIREEEEYEYDIRRKRIIAENEYHDEWDAIRKADEATSAEVNARLEAVQAQENEIAEMKETIAGIDERIATAFEEGRTAGEKEAAREYGYKKAMAEKEHEYALKDLNNQIATLKEALLEKNNKIGSLEEKLDDAYSKIDSMARSTVEAAGGVKILNGNPSNQSK